MSLRQIVNASPLILLSKTGQLDLLRIGGVDVVTPDAVIYSATPYPAPCSWLLGGDGGLAPERLFRLMEDQDESHGFSFTGRLGMREVKGGR